MKIALFTDVFLDVIGGIRTSIEAQKSDLEKLGHTVYVFCPGKKPSEDSSLRIVPTNRLLSIPGIPVAKWPKKVMPYVRKELEELGIDVVHSHYELSCSISGMKVAREMGLPLVQTMHGREDVAVQKNVWPGVNIFVSWALCVIHARLIPHTIKVKRDGFLTKTRTARNMWEVMVNHANYADYVIFPSQHFEKKFRHYGLKKPVEIVSNGLSDEMIKKIGKVAVRDLKPREKLRIVWFSRMSREKRPLQFLEAVRESGISVHLDMYGDGNLEDRARWYASRHGMKGVKVWGRAEHDTVLEKTRTAHIAILNSYGFDNQPMTLLEGTATGLPVIIVDPDMEEVLPKGGYIYVNTPEVGDMAEALRDLVAHPEKIREMSEAVMAEKDMALQSRQTAKLLMVYEKVTSE